MALRITCYLVAFCLLLPQASAAGAPARKPAPNVILITIDTVRADHLGCYGSTTVQTPTLDALARDGVLFERAIAQVPQTWPSHAVILTGTYPFQNGVQDFTGQPLEPRFRSVAEAFKQHGYTTGAVVSAFVLDRSWGLARGFDFYDDAFDPEQFLHRDLGLVERKADESITRALNWLKKAPRPFFFWLHLYDPHSAYDPPEPYRTQYRDHPYDGEIAYADHELGRLMEWLKRSQLYDRSLIVMLSDHGESLGDHGETQHGFFIYNSTVQVPLIVKPPAGSGSRPGRVSRPVETAALAPTLLQLAGIKDPITKQFSVSGLFGKDVEKKEDAAYSETFYPFSSYGWSPLHAIETSRYHYIDAPRPELYDLNTDPAEANNIASMQTATVAVLKDKLQQLLKRDPYKPAPNESAGVSPDALDKLRALGYVAYRSPVSAEALATGLPDPKDKLEEFNLILKATDAFHAGDVATGRALLAEVREQDPKMYIVPFLLGQAALGQQNWDEAASEMRKCLDLNPNFDQAMTALARALMYLGRLDEAKQWARKALQYNSQNYRAWYELGFIDAKTDKKAAIGHYEKAVSIQADFAPLRRDLGLLQFQEQNYREAAKHLAKAIELGLNDALLYNFLGISYSRTSRLRKAVEAYQQALKLDPQMAQAHLNLAYAYQRLNQARNAMQEYQAACKLQSNLCEYVPGPDSK